MGNKEVALRIRTRRKELKLTQTELADKIGVSLMTVVRWEKGERTPNTSVMNQLAEALDTSVAYLMGLDSEDDGSIMAEKVATSSKQQFIFPSLAYWGEVVDNARKAAQNGQSLGSIYSLLTDATGIVRAAMA